MLRMTSCFRSTDTATIKSRINCLLQGHRFHYNNYHLHRCPSNHQYQGMHSIQLVSKRYWLVLKL